MISKEQLLRINELKLSGIINTMNDSQFNIYLQTLGAFITKAPEYAEALSNAAETGQYSLLSGRLSGLYSILAKLHADGLAADCKKQINALSAGRDTIDEDEIEAAIENLVQGISALSIDIQMASHRSTAAPPAAAAAPAARPGFGKTTVLAVDNAVMFLNTLKKVLSGTAYELHCVTSGSEALEFIGINRPDIILLDIEMPDMNGYELAQRIKKTGSRAPIIFITANSAKEYVDKAVEVGAAGLLMKPLRANQLLAKLKENS